MSDATADTLPLITDPLESARAIGLRYVSDTEPGLRRERDGAVFVYRDAAGKLVTTPRVLARIDALHIPPAWDEVWICRRADGHLQATGRDARGRKQYRYHPDWNATRNQTKYHRMQQFGAALPGLRERIDADLARRGLPRDKVLATVLRLMELTYIRIGNVEYARANSSYGLTTLRDKHVQVDGAAIRFQFVGKSGQKHAIDVKDRRLARIVKQCRDIPGYELFQYYDEAGERQRVGSGDVNDYLRMATGAAFSAKDLRTWGGSVLAAAALATLGPAESETAARRNVVQVVKDVAGALGNRPATCRKYYVHPAVLAAYASGALAAHWADDVAAAEATSSAGLTAEESAFLALLGRAALSEK
ncbi:MAG: DNA topoisomerase IB [Candidatus Promineofilum sp.]|jgi:DNA topoisomerase-1|nr:DNA topoisomerase IB [Promineifilum sp.]